MAGGLSSLALILVILSLVAAATPSAARAPTQGTPIPPSWSLVPPYSYPLPTARAFMSVAPIGAPYGGVLLFGGLGCGGTCNDTWILSTGQGFLQWGGRLVPGPSGREGAAMAGDVAGNQAILFGGRDATSYFGDTWRFNETPETWQRLSPVASPPPLAFAAATWMTANDSLLLFGGEDASGGAMGATWSFSHGNWTQVPTTLSPSPRWGASMAYDPTEGLVYLFGGTDGSQTFSDLWTFGGGHWTEMTPAVSPGARSFATLSTTAGGYPVLVGGLGAAGPLNDTWMFTGPGGSWQNLTPLFNPLAASPDPMKGAGLVADSDLGYNIFLLIGGIPNATRDLVSWTLDIPSGGTPGGLSVAIHLAAPNGTSPFTDTLTAEINGGSPPYNITWDFGDGSPSGYGAQVTHVFQASVARAYVVQAAVSDSAGHRASSTTLIDVASPPPPPKPPGTPLWVTYAALAVGVAGVGFLISYPLRSYRSARRLHTAAMRALGGDAYPPALPFPASLVPLMTTFVESWEIEGLLWGVLQEVRRWSLHLLDRVQKWLRFRRRQGVWLVNLLSSALAKMVFVVTLLFVITQALSGPDKSATWYLQGWGRALVDFFSGQWLYTPVSLPGNLGVIPFSYYFAASLELILVGIVLSVVISYPLGMLSGWLRGGRFDAGVRGYAAGALYFPPIAISLILIGWFYTAWIGAFGMDTTIFGILPSTEPWYSDHMGGIPSWISLYGYTTPTGFPLLDAGLHGAWVLEEIVLWKTLLQGFIIALVYSAVYLRYLRLAVVEAAEEPHLVAARSRGVREGRLLWHHASRRALPLYVSSFSITFGAFLFTEAMVEVIFADFGMGRAVFGTVDGGFTSSLVPLIYIFALLVILTNLTADLLVGALDARVTSGQLVGRR